MSRDEFIKTASKLGYCNKKQAEKYCDHTNKDNYTDDDFIEVYRMADEQRYRVRGHVLFGGGRTSKNYLLDGGSEGNR